MTPIFLLMLFPILVIIAMKIWRPKKFSWLEAGAQLVLSLIVIVGLYMGGKYMEMSSVEFWTGTIQSKSYNDGQYRTSYQCNCRSTGSGNSKTTTCDTCYTDNYTREWLLQTTIGNIETSSIDTTSRLRRNGFDADQYWRGAYKGEACSKTNTYLNYVQAAEYSLLNRSGTNEGFAKAGLLPKYPQLYGIYKLNRVMDLGVGVPNIKEWRLMLDDYMKTLGGLKQINIFVIFVPTTDPSYTAALEAYWRGANKNDTIIIVGVEKGIEATGMIVGMIDVITWAKDPLYKINLIGDLLAVTETDYKFDPTTFLKTVNDVTLRDYDRLPMATFENLKDEIDPPLWIIILCIIFAVPGSLGLALLFDRIDLDAKIFGRSRRF